MASETQHEKLERLLNSPFWTLLPVTMDCRHYRAAYKFKNKHSGREEIVFTCGRGCGE